MTCLICSVQHSRSEEHVRSSTTGRDTPVMGTHAILQAQLPLFVLDRVEMMPPCAAPSLTTLFTQCDEGLVFFVVNRVHPNVRYEPCSSNHRRLPATFVTYARTGTKHAGGAD
jgi:hypothetical protein